MRLSLVVSSALVLASLASLAGCAASQSDGSEASHAAFSTDAGSAGSACGSAKYADALVHYKNAVAGAKGRASKDICETALGGDSGTLAYIAEESYAAVQTCADFRNTIATSPYAEPIRSALSTSLELPLLTGTLAESAPWAGLATALPGKTVWGPVADVSGLSVSKLVFSDHGKVTRSNPNQEDVAMTGPVPGEVGAWTVDPASGVVTVTVAGKASKYALRFEKDLGSFGLVLGSTDGTTDDYLSIVRECEGS